MDCFEAGFTVNGVVLKVEPGIEEELFANGVAALAVGAVANRESVVLTESEGADVEKVVRDEMKRYAAGEATEKAGQLFVSVGGRKNPMDEGSPIRDEEVRSRQPPEN